MQVTIFCNDSTKNKQTISIKAGETLGELKQRLGEEGAKFIYSGKLLHDEDDLSAVIKEDNPNIHLFVQMKEASSDKVAEESKGQETGGESSGWETSDSSPKLQATQSVVSPELLGLPKYSTEPFTPRIIIINGQKYKVETGDAMPIPEGVDVEEIRRRMSTSVLRLHLSSRPILFDPAAPQVNGLGMGQVPGLAELNQNDIPVHLRQQLLNRPVIRVVFNVAEWGDILGQLFKLGVACYFVTRYLSFPRAVIACIVFTLFFLSGVGFFDYVQRNVFGVRPAAPAPPPAVPPQNAAPPQGDAQANNNDAPVEVRPQDPETLLSMVRAALVGFFTSMFPENIPQRAAEA